MGTMAKSSLHLLHPISHGHKKGNLQQNFQAINETGEIKKICFPLGDGEFPPPEGDGQLRELPRGPVEGHPYRDEQEER